MSFLIRRQLNDEEKAIVLKGYGRRCFSSGHLIPDGEEVQFDHIHAYSKGGESELNNIAPMCATHNKEKGALSLNDFRVKLRLEDFFKSGEKVTLRHLLKFLVQGKDIQSFGASVALQKQNGRILIESTTNKYEHSAYKCPTTGWTYCYLTLPVELLDSDDDHDNEIGLQPRYLIEDKVFNMFRHFQLHPVLQPSVGRLVGNTIRLFDGQHKIAALLLNGRKEFECKIYVDSEVRLLNQTNIAAHDRFAQTRFYSSIMVLKLGNQFGKDFEDYKNLESEPKKTESGFMDYLRRLDADVSTRGDLNQRFRSHLYSSILENPENKMKDLVSASNRSSLKTPITMDALQKSLFSAFLYREPTSDDMTSTAYKRDSETTNMVEIMNMFFELGLHSWSPEAGENDATQRTLDRLIRSKSMMAWAELLRDAICGKLDLHDAGDREMPLYRDFSDQEKQRIRSVIERLFSWKHWQAPAEDEIDRVLSDNKSAVKSWFREHGLTTGYLMGAPQ